MTLVKEVHALRYLLLRHLDRIRDDAPADIVKQVADSLKVVAEDRAFVVTWTRGQEQLSTRMPEGTFFFYKTSRAVEASQTPGCGSQQIDNDTPARNWALVALDIKRTVSVERHILLDPYFKFDSIISSLVAVAVVSLGGPFGWTMSIAILLHHLMERSGLWGRVVLAIGWVPVANFFPLSTSLALAVFAAFQFFDPNPARRRARFAVAVAALAAVLTLASWLKAPESFAVQAYVWQIWLAVAIALLVTARIWLRRTHTRTLPLILPLLVIGLLVDGFTAAGWVVVGIVTAGHELHRLWLRSSPVQAALDLAPNG